MVYRLLGRVGHKWVDISSLEESNLDAGSIVGWHSLLWRNNGDHDAGEEEEVELVERRMALSDDVILVVDLDDVTALLVLPARSSSWYSISRRSPRRRLSPVPSPPPLRCSVRCCLAAGTTSRVYFLFGGVYVIDDIRRKLTTTTIIATNRCYC